MIGLDSLTCVILEHIPHYLLLHSRPVDFFFKSSYILLVPGWIEYREQ
jgi:hypothetical protein